MSEQMLLARIQSDRVHVIEWVVSPTSMKNPAAVPPR
jgi:hypothetical protein